MKPLLSLTKQELADIINDCREQEDALNEICDSQQHTIDSMRMDVDIYEGNIIKLGRRIDRIVEAMETIVAIKFPNANLDGFEPSQQLYMGEDVKVDPDCESQELLLIQHLYRLSK